MSIIVPVSATAGTSATFTLAAGDEARLSLVPGAAGFQGDETAEVITLVDGVWVAIGVLAAGELEKRCRVLSAAGDYRVTKAAGLEFGVDKA
jgi:hypothetical protein